VIEAYDRVLTWCRQTDSGDGRLMIDVPWVRTSLARCYAKITALRLLNWRMAWAIADGNLGPADSSSVKVYGTETSVEVMNNLAQIMGLDGMVATDPPGSTLGGVVEHLVRATQISTFGGGVNEVQRDIVAAAGLGMVRSAR
jgi:alkylation response protein AidB-like acyl-CoA dehydrogenase